MKSYTLAAGLRVTFSKTELETLLILLRYAANDLGADHRLYLSDRQKTLAVDMVQGLETGMSSLRFKQAEAKARRDAPKREAERRAAREYHAEIDGYIVSGMLGDWTDVSDDPDQRRWADMFNPDTQTQLREQSEIRRNVWRIQIWKGRFASDDLVVLPSDCTMTANRDEIAVLARRIITSASP